MYWRPRSWRLLSARECVHIQTGQNALGRLGWHGQKPGNRFPVGTQGQLYKLTFMFLFQFCAPQYGLA